MKKYLFICTLMIIITRSLTGQYLKPETISTAYLGEMITHPGLRITAEYQLKGWEKTTGEKEPRVQHTIRFLPSAGIFYHRRYQSGLLINGEFGFEYSRPGKVDWCIGAGPGYMRTLVPNSYLTDEAGTITRMPAGHNYFITTLFISAGNELNHGEANNLAWYVKPNVTYALPAFPKGTLYLFLELGLKFKLP